MKAQDYRDQGLTPPHQVHSPGLPLHQKPPPGFVWREARTVIDHDAGIGEPSPSFQDPAKAYEDAKRRWPWRGPKPQERKP